MHRVRSIAATPFRTAADAWNTAKDLIVATLDRSSQIVEGTVASELSAVDGVGAMLTAAGHLNSRPLTLVDGTLHADIRLITGEPSFTVDENLTPIPGGANASTSWKLYIDAPPHLRPVVEAACAGSTHVVAGKAPAPVETEKASNSAWNIDSTALRRIGDAS